MPKRAMACETLPDRSPTRKTPSIIIFLAADFGSFLLFFFVFMTERLKQPQMFGAAATTLNVGIGLINTLLLITSGWVVALAVNACLANDRSRARALLLAGVFTASAFVLLKCVEYREKYLAGIGITTNSFFSFYYVLTGLHLFHVIVGLAVLLLMRRWVGSEPDSDVMKSRIVSGSLYWHLVDLLWIFLFPLFYLQGN